MKARNYIILCMAISLVVSATILFVPGLSDNFESWLLGFLASIARA